MVKRGVLGVFVILGLALVLVSFASAAVTINRAWIIDSDNFYSNSQNNDVVNLMVNITNTSAIAPGAAIANFTNFTTACGTSGIVSLAYNSSGNGNGIWNASCNVSATAKALIGSNFSGGGIVIVASDGGAPGIDTNLSAVLYNMTRPQMPQGGCQRFGSLTTNFLDVLDFARVNFMIHIQNNFTCMVQQGGGSAPPGLSSDYVDVMKMNLTSVNLSTPEQARLLAQLPSVLTLNISQPKTFPSIAKISVNGSAFTALNTNASISLLNLPFTARPNVSSDNLSELVSTSWVSNGYDSSFRIVTGNLTINVLGFTEYNASDIAAPSISINSPAQINVSASTTNIIFSALVNGTGTQPSLVTITNASGGGLYNYTESSGSNSANCLSITSNNETYNCTVVFPVAGLPEGTSTITVTAYDYGGSSGNTNTSSRSFTVDRTGPVITVYSPAASSMKNNRTVLFNISASDSYTAPSMCWGYLNNTSFLMTKSGSYFNYTNASLGDGVWTLNNFTCNDSVGNVGNTSSYTFVVDATAPTSLNITLGTPTSSGVTVYFTANEAIASVNLSYGTSTALGSLSTATIGNTTSGSASISGLIANNLYYFNVTAYDLAGNYLTNGTFNFTTAAAATNGSSGESGGSSGGGSYGTYILQSFQLEKGYTKEFAKNGAIKFSINSESHSLTVKEITNESVTISLASTPQIATLSIGEEKKFDLNADNVYDLYVKLNRISIHKLASITVQTISEAIAPVVPAGKEEKPSIKEEITAELKKSSTWLWILAIIGIIAVVVALYFVSKSYLKFRRIR